MALSDSSKDFYIWKILKRSLEVIFTFKTPADHKRSEPPVIGNHQMKGSYDEDMAFLWIWIYCCEREMSSDPWPHTHLTWRWSPRAAAWLLRSWLRSRWPAAGSWWWGRMGCWRSCGRWCWPRRTPASERPVRKSIIINIIIIIIIMLCLQR